MILKSTSLGSNAEMQISETANDDGDSFYIQVDNGINPGRITVNKDELRAAILPELTEGVGQPTLTSKEPWVTPSGNYVLYDEDDSRITLNVSRHDSYPGLLQLILSNEANNTSMRTFLRGEDLLTALDVDHLGASLASQLDKVIKVIEHWENGSDGTAERHAKVLRVALNAFTLPTLDGAIIAGNPTDDRSKTTTLVRVNGEWHVLGGHASHTGNEVLSNFLNLRLIRDGIEIEA
jgi:hypothetical protein